MTTPAPQPWIRLESALSGANPLAWLHSRREGIKTYWASREGEFEMAGAGSAEWVKGDGASDLDALFQTLSQKLSEASARCRFYGGFRFGQGTVRNGAWEPFGPFYFVVPRFEVVRRGNTVVLALNARKNELPKFKRAFNALFQHLQQGSHKRAKPVTWSEPLKRTDIPARRQWMANVQAALKAVEMGACEKIVLARKTQLGFRSAVDPFSILGNLKSANPGCYHFCFQCGSGQAFIGGSPERLYHRAGPTVQTEAVAGTRPRGKDAGDDRRLGLELLSSEKDLWEHELVVRGIHEEMGKLCHKLHLLPGPRLFRLEGLQHLQRGFRGTLRPGVTDADLLNALHPTPAVSGYPSRLALNEIRRLETFDRGWYAAPVGWVGKTGAEFAVGIRSGLVSGRSLTLFSGAGVVAGSIPAAEWDEIESKIGGFLQAIKA